MRILRWRPEGRPSSGLVLEIAVLVLALAAPALALTMDRLDEIEDAPPRAGAEQAAVTSSSRAELTTLRGATWNALRDRSPGRVRQFLTERVAELDLDFVLLQEFQTYWRRLLERPIPGYRLVLPNPMDRGDTQNPILVRSGLLTREPVVLQLSARGYGTHAPIYGVSVVLEGIRLVSVHAPLALPFRDGQLPGPEEMVAAFRTMMRSLEAAAGHDRVLRRDTILGGDWNATAAERGRHSPHWLSRRTGLQIVEPTPRYGVGHDRIDFVFTDRPIPVMARAGTGGSDHAFIWFEVGPD